MLCESGKPFIIIIIVVVVVVVVVVILAILKRHEVLNMCKRTLFPNRKIRDLGGWGHVYGAFPCFFQVQAWQN